MTAIQKFITDRSFLFWSVGDLTKVSDPLLVETILNYGSAEDVKQLFALQGIEKTASIFRNATENRLRQNYFPEVKNFFTLYFNRHVRATS